MFKKEACTMWPEQQEGWRVRGEEAQGSGPAQELPRARGEGKDGSAHQGSPSSRGQRFSEKPVCLSASWIFPLTQEYSALLPRAATAIPGDSDGWDVLSRDLRRGSV